ncbi:GH24583 [Drosophila grimshawi]|uniref:GH24583 n=1 Tax=Drosophila grimshawi TaxID=7222 RepID=B4JM57_DROGR|nr:GH24583 [Drosophila grimshawi]
MWQPQAAAAAASAKSKRVDFFARTGDNLVRLPFFGGGVAQLLRYLRPLDPTADNGGLARRSALRMSLDENYVSYRGAQLWKLNFNGTRKNGDNSPDAQFTQFVEDFGE